jgi:hypothetical protein
MEESDCVVFVRVLKHCPSIFLEVPRNTNLSIKIMNYSTQIRTWAPPSARAVFVSEVPRITANIISQDSGVPLEI